MEGHCRIEDLYDKNNNPREEDIHLETDTEEDVKGHRYFSANLKQHSVN